METTYSTRPPLSSATLNTTPLIRPNRHSLDDRFPQLGFTVQTGEKPYFEVLLTTDRALFDTRRAGDRTPANFFPASSEDRILLPATDGSAVFIVPQAVLHKFASAVPRPQAIYYTAVSYTDTAANQPAFAHPQETLPTQAPSVLLPSGFRAETIAAVLGIPVNRLRSFQIEASSDALSAPLWERKNVPNEETSALNAPQDGYEYYHMVNVPSEQSYELSDNEGIGDSGDRLDSFDEPSSDRRQEAEIDDSEEEQPAGYARPQQSRFPADMPEPAALRDSEETWPPLSEEEGSSFTYDDGYGDMPSANALGDGPDVASLSATDYDVDQDEEWTQSMAPTNISASRGNPYRDEADDYSYEESFAAEADDIFQPEIPYEPLSAPPLSTNTVAPQPFTIEVQRNIIEQIAGFESGRDGYSAMNRDGEFRGLFGQDHPAYNRYHIGLSYGIIQFTQDSGNLGRLLTMMQARDPAYFTTTFGPDSDNLLRTTTVPGPGSADSPGGRSARVQPVGGTDLWEEPWTGRFAKAGRHIAFQAAQNELAAQLFLTPVLPFARWLGFTTDRSLAILVDRAVQMGVGGACTWIIRAVGPIQTLAQRQQALTALGHADLRSFQRATPGLVDDGNWGAQTHAALIAALRALGPASPIEIPTRDQMLSAIVRQSASERWSHRVQTLRDAAGFSDAVYKF